MFHCLTLKKASAEHTNFWFRLKSFLYALIIKNKVY